MKKMKRFEQICYLIAILGIVLKVLKIPGGNILFVFTLLAVSILYYIFGFLLFNNIKLRHIFKSKSYSHTTLIRTFGAVFAGMVLSLLLVGILFRVQHWPGSEINIQIGWFSGALLLIVSLYKYLKTKDDIYIQVLQRVIVLIIISVIVYISIDNATNNRQIEKQPNTEECTDTVKADTGISFEMQLLDSEQLQPGIESILSCKLINADNYENVQVYISQGSLRRKDEIHWIARPQEVGKVSFFVSYYKDGRSIQLGRKEFDVVDKLE